MDEDLFDSVENLEKFHAEQGSKDGALIGKERQYKEGFSKGWQQACHLQQELGVLQGIILTYLNNFSRSSEIGATDNTKPRNKVDNSSCKKSKQSDKTKISLEKYLAKIQDTQYWIQLGISSEEKLASELTALHANTKFLLRKLDIPVAITERSVDTEF